jgi:hypothetical protein
MAGMAETNDQFGDTLAAGDFNGDDFSDLAIGAPGEGASGLASVGVVHILYGAAIGLSAARNQLFSQNTPGIEEETNVRDIFGDTLAAGDFDNDGFSDLAIGAPGERFSGLASAGVVHILYGTATGLSAARNQLFSQQTPDIVGAAEASDVFGDVLATGDFDDDGFSDLAIGAPGESLGTLTNAGVVHILYGTATGLSATRSRLFSQETPGMAGVAEADGRFGETLATGDFDNDGFSDLAIGAPFENIAAITDAGAVHVLYGTDAGLSATGNQLFSQETPGITGRAEDGDGFGHTLEPFPVSVLGL